MGALKRLRLDSCGALEVRREAAALQQLSSVSLRQCRLEAIGCLNNLLSLPALDVRPSRFYSVDLLAYKKQGF